MPEPYWIAAGAAFAAWEYADTRRRAAAARHRANRRESDPANRRDTNHAAPVHRRRP